MNLLFSKEILTKTSMLTESLNTALVFSPVISKYIKIQPNENTCKVSNRLFTQSYHFKSLWQIQDIGASAFE